MCFINLQLIIKTLKMYAKNNTYLLFEKSARLYPHVHCLFCEDKIMTYSELEKEVSKVHLDVLEFANNERIIGLSATRGVDQIISMLAILKSGKAYLPIDFSYPKIVLQKIIANSNLKFCLSNKVQEPIVIEMGLRLLKKSNKPNITESRQDLMSENGAYILYTSGTTGDPKGVCMGQDAIINLIHWQNENSISKKGTITLQFAPLTFDVSFQEIMATLSTGGTLVLIEESIRLDMRALLYFLKKHQINRIFLPFVALQALAEAAINNKVFPYSLKEIMTAGEQLKITPTIRSFFEALNNCILYNQYGPTECHVVTQLKLVGNPELWPALPSIGKPITKTSIFILNQNQEIVADTEIGELYIAGVCLAEGYLNNKQLTEKSFIDWKLPEGKNIRLYRSGDIARYLENGNIEFLGRKDDQIKIRGHRIELAEIELIINSLNSVKQAVVLSSNHLGESQIVAYIQVKDLSIDITNIRNEVLKLLPVYMVPSYFILIENLPFTSSGKIDKKALPIPQYIRPDSAPILRKPATKIEHDIVKIWHEQLQIPIIGIDDNFFEMGGSSLLTQRLVFQLNKQMNLNVSATNIYQYPTISLLIKYLEERDTIPLHVVPKSKVGKKSLDVAIIGMAGRFPGADTIDELWDVLKEGKETIRFFHKEELDSSLPDSLRNDPLYVGARGIIASANTFDASFFGINPKLAEVMDPQIRLFLEIAWEVLEQSGYLPRYYNGSVGVYAGVGTNTYYKKNILPNTAVLESVGYFQAETVNEKDYIASRTAYHLNLKGPAVSIHSACSTSLLAIAEAVESIRNGNCEIALAGGSSVTAPIFSGHLYQEGSMLSPDGHCRSFDAAAKGTVFSDGAGVILLKSLETAQKDGDRVYGLIKGIGVSNDGGNKGSFTAPSAEGQAIAIKKAIQDAQIEPSTISYIETHGTATPLGDPIEIEGLKLAFGSQPKNGVCALGSIKSNMGHLTAAAGVAGLIKTILAMNHKLIPPSLGFKRANPIIDFENSPFYVNSELINWQSNELVRAGVSSFGVGGTNVHVVLEEYVEGPKISGLSRPFQLLKWSAKSEHSLACYKTKLGNFLKDHQNLKLADVSYSLDQTRDSFAHRSFLVSSNCIEAQKELLLIENKNIKISHLAIAPSEIVFLFPGQGSQFSQMGWDFYKNESVFKKAVDQCAEILLEKIHIDIRKILYPEKVTLETEAKLKDTRFTQPALFVTEYALAQLWLSWGIKPTQLCGHSIGEFVAAHLAGVLSLKDVLHLIALRGQLVSQLPTGSMLSIRMTEDKLMEIIPTTLSLAAINSKALCVVAGEDLAIRNFAESLDHLEIANKLLATSHAFHSAMMNPILETFEAEVKKITLNKPNIPIISTVTGLKLTDGEASSSRYWSDHLRQTVKFAAAADTLLKLDNPIFLEIGPSQTLITLTKQQGAGKTVAAFASLLQTKDDQNEYTTILTSLGELWLRGVESQPDIFYNDQQRHQIELPSYVFDRKFCWIDPPGTLHQDHPSKNNVAEYSFTNLKKNNDMRKTTILNKISSIVNQTSGIDFPVDTFSQSFLDLGLDSLLLTQLAIRLKKDFKLPITFRQLNEQFNSPHLLADYIHQNISEEEQPHKMINAPVKDITENLFITPKQSIPIPQDHNTATLGLIAQQLQLLGKQMELLQVNTLAQSTGILYKEINNSIAESSFPKNTTQDSRTAEEIMEHQKPFGASPKIEKQIKEMSYSQKQFLNELINRYSKKTAGSKSSTQKNRSFMADPRVVSGFKPLTKEIVYPIVIEKSSGNRLWDIDGNEYIDALNGFGSCIFGHQPDFIKETLHNQIENGFEVGPQHPLAGEVCELLCEFTGHERAALCNTGSEAVLGAIRIARTVTGRSLIVAFSGSYHGIIDEALVRGSKKLITFPAAPGIMPESVQNMLILEYGTEESLQIIAARADELAAVLVEPVQSRRPEFQPIEFLHKLRSLTTQSEIALIFDEVITGFRVHPGGAQALFDIHADIATYGKVIGGGLSIGAIAGKRKYMDALDGGQWQFGDDSIPEVGVTYFAGTFVRHPLALAASKASLIHLKNKGSMLQEKLNEMTTCLASELNIEFTNRKLPMRINHFGSLWRLKFDDDVQYGELLFTLLRENGIHIWDGFPCFLTESYTKADIHKIINSFVLCLDSMLSVGFFTKIKINNDLSTDSSKLKNINTPPIAGAKLGRDEEGNPAWFILDTNINGDYFKIDL
ncbi:polyketide synthase [Flavobacterium segetis]|nr:polyketide synthase [Flavobacterium segetis]